MTTSSQVVPLLTCTLPDLVAMSKRCSNLAVGTLNGELYEVYLTDKEGQTLTIKPSSYGAVREVDNWAELVVPS